MYCSLNNIPIDESLTTADDKMETDDVDMDVDDNEEEEFGGFGEDKMEDNDEDMPSFFNEIADDAKDAKTPARNPKSKVALIVKKKVNTVLEKTGLTEKRARQCDQNDFLKLLLAFHDEGIHFS